MGLSQAPARPSKAHSAKGTAGAGDQHVHVVTLLRCVNTSAGAG
jgi:hypothetical protein